MTIKYLVLVGIISCLLGCSNESAQATRNDNKEKSVPSNLSIPEPESVAKSPVKVVGDFTNVQSNGEHQWGYSVQIWRQDDRIFGLFSGTSSPMLVGDPPTGILVEQVFDEKTGKLSFSTELPSFTYSFDGTLKNDRLTGRLFNTTTNKTEHVTLKRSEESSSEMMDEFESYEDWKRYADGILKFRGPKR
jgi:hypothetical protein